jgi:hypothetical protein
MDMDMDVDIDTDIDRDMDYGRHRARISECVLAMARFRCRIRGIGRNFIPISRVMLDSAPFSPPRSVPRSDIVHHGDRNRVSTFAFKSQSRRPAIYVEIFFK